jgi:CyaY protein
MTDADYHDRAEAVLERIEDALEQGGLDLELDLDIARRGKVLEIGFRGGAQVVVNLQPPLHELWLASRLGGFHFKFDGQHWRDTKTGGEFFALLSQALSHHAGRPIEIGAG